MGVLYRGVRWERSRQNESVSKQAAKAIHNGTEVKETNLFEFCCCCGLSPERKEIVSRRSGDVISHPQAYRFNVVSTNRRLKL